MPQSNRDRVAKRRQAQRAAGLRPIQIWVPDTRGAQFAQECRRQARLVARADAQDKDLAVILDDALTDLIRSETP